MVKESPRLSQGRQSMDFKKYAYPLAAVLVAALLIVIYVVVKTPQSVPTVAVGDNVSVFYTGTLANGTVFDSNVGKEPLTFTVGSGQLIKGFDQGVLGMKLNQTKTIVIPANDAYGPINPQLLVEVPKSQFGNQSVKVGMYVSGPTSNGQPMQGVITAVNSTTATVNFNSPLAGQNLTFKIQVVSIKTPGQ